MPLNQFQSSGNLTADRRYAYAVELLAEGDAQAAGDLIEQALELVPNWPAGWFTLAEAREASGDRAAAIAAFERALTLDASDTLGARLHLTRLGAKPTPDQPPAAYVRGLFDAYASQFDRALVDGLDYRAPRLLASALERIVGGRPFRRCLDLGCGTGLMAEALTGMTGEIDGIDLSANMIEIARSKALYRDLRVADIGVAMANQPPACYALITAADVFCYLGDLTTTIAAAARILTSDGLLAFSVESLLETDGSNTYALAESLRYRHAPRYIESIVSEAGLDLLHMSTENLRKDRGAFIEGLVVVAKKGFETRT